MARKRHMLLVPKSMWTDVVQVAAEETIRRSKEVSTSDMARKLVRAGLEQYRETYKKQA